MNTDHRLLTRRAPTRLFGAEEAAYHHQLDIALWWERQGSKYLRGRFVHTHKGRRRRQHVVRLQKAPGSRPSRVMGDRLRTRQRHRDIVADMIMAPPAPDMKRALLQGRTAAFVAHSLQVAGIGLVQRSD